GDQRTNFYTHTRSEGLSPDVVRDRRDLFLALGALRGMERAEEDRLGTFPCARCEESGACFGEGVSDQGTPPVLKRLAPLCFYDAYVIVSELVAFHYDEACDLLGGMTGEAFETAYPAADNQWGGSYKISRAKALLEDDGPKVFFGLDGSGLDAVEHLRLKLGLFTQVCKAVYDFHRKGGLAHLCLEPRSILVEADNTATGPPGLWNFRAKLVSLASAAVYEGPGEGEELRLAPPAGADPLYMAPITRGGEFGVLRPADFIISKIDESPLDEDKIGMTIEGDLIPKSADIDSWSPKDLFFVVIQGGAMGTDSISLWCRCISDKSGGSGNEGLAIQSHPVAVKNQDRTAILGIRGIRLSGVQYALYPCHHIPCDLFSLGMLLIRAILVNDSRNLWQIVPVLDEITRKAKKAGPLYERIYTEAVAAFSSTGHEDVLDRSNIFYHAIERVPTRPNAIPAELWHNVLNVALRLITSIPGFSFCSDHGDFDPAYPAGSMEPLLEELGHINAQLDLLLFSQDRHNIEVREVIRELMGVFDKSGTLPSKPSSDTSRFRGD
ncbi:hypothetical protein ACFL4G_11200, partial [Thermodesulfobacteriota bacterium]